MTPPGPSPAQRPSNAQRRARRAVRFQRLGPAKGLAGLMATAGVLVPAEMLLRAVSRSKRPLLPIWFHRGLARSLGIRIVTHGRPARRRGVLFVANHVSWADIPVLGARIRGAFVAKSEVGTWGPIGFLASLADTVYVERQRPGRAGEQRDTIAARLAVGENIILFPEGTNSDGARVLPFKSSLFGIVGGGAEGVANLLVQPVTIAYTRVNGMPVTRERLPDLAWIGDTELMPHAMAFMALGRVRAELLFHPPVRPADFADRKDLARHCELVVAEGYRLLMRGDFKSN
jgi:lyso-ornithine lipid O-acyltransferase